MTGFVFCFVCCLDEASCIGCYWWLGDAGSCIPVVLFLWVLTFWYPLGLVQEKAMAPQSSTLAWKIPWMQEPGRLQSMGSLRVGHDWSNLVVVVVVVKNQPANAGDARNAGSIPEWGRSPGVGNLFQYSCLENTMDRGARWATVHRVEKSRTRLINLTKSSINGNPHQYSCLENPMEGEAW